MPTTDKPEKIKIWTIGHSNLSIEKFTALLEENRIQLLADVRRFPTSRIEHFRREQMEEWLSKRGIRYVWLGERLGGYRRGGYETYTRSKAFLDGLEELLEYARMKRTCIMCMESDPRYCHRRFIAARLEMEGVEVIHILKKGQRDGVEVLVKNFLNVLNLPTISSF